MATLITLPNIIIKPYTPIEWRVNTTIVYDAGLTPDIVGNFSVTKHLPLNNDVVDLNCFSDVFVDNEITSHRYIDCDFDSVSVNVNNKEIAPRYEYCLNKNINQSELQTKIEDCAELRTLTKYEEYSKYGKVYFTLTPKASETLINIGKSFSYCGTTSFSLTGKTHLVLKDLSLNEHASNDIGEVCDSLVLKKDDNSNNAYTKFDSININLKDFNMKSGTDFKNKKSLSGTVNDSSKTTDYFAETFRSHFNEYKSTFKVKYPFSGTYTQVSQIFDGVLFKNYSNAQIAAMNSPVGESTIKELDFAPSTNKNFFKFIPSGIHRVGVKEYYSGAGTTDVAITYETKYVNMTDFSNRGSFDYIYKNMIRPLLIKYQTITKRGATFISSVTEKILPEVAQSYKFTRDYILKSIKPYFSAVGNTYNANIAVYFGFLINGKVHENGIIHTEILTYEDLVDGYDLPLPIHIPANKEFFIGFLTIPDEGESIELKYIENGQYDTNGYLVSFPSDVQTVMIDGDTQYTSRMLKIDVDVFVYDVEQNIAEQSDDNFFNPSFQSNAEYTSAVEIETIPLVQGINRFMFFSNDIIPSSANLEYKFGTPFSVTSVGGEAVNPTTDYNFFTINPNDEYILPKLTTNYKFKYYIQTYDKYQSPILKPLEYNYVLKKYEQTETTKLVMNEPSMISNNIIGYSSVTYTGSSFKVQLKNLNGIYKSEYYDDFMKNSKFYSGDTNLDETGFVIRLVFDYFQQGVEDTFMKNRIPIDVKARNVFTGKTYRCYTSSLAFKQNNKINNPTGITSTSLDLGTGWKKKTIEFIPFLIDDINNNFFKIKNIEDWEFDIEIIVENTNSVNTVIRNILTSVDSIIVDLNLPSFKLIAPVYPPVAMLELASITAYNMTAPIVTQITP